MNPQPLYFIIIEDVERQRDYLKSWLEATRPDLSCAADFSNHLDAYLFLLSKDTPSVDLIFLDIELPGKRDGLNLLELLHGKLKRYPKIIIISGNDYLLETYEQVYPISGYILKPIDEEKLSKAIDKAIALIAPSPQTQPSIEFIEFGGMLVPIKDILYFDSRNSDKTLHRKGGEKVSDRMSMEDLEKKLDGTRFLRIHESFIVNISPKYFHGVDKKHTIYTLICPQTDKIYPIPISQKYREAVKKRFL